MISIYSYARVLYLPSHFTFSTYTRSSVIINLGANPRAPAVYTLSSYAGTSLLSVAPYIFLALCMPVCTRRDVFLRCSLFRAARPGIRLFEGKTRISFRDTGILTSRSSVAPATSDVSFVRFATFDTRNGGRRVGPLTFLRTRERQVDDDENAGNTCAYARAVSPFRFAQHIRVLHHHEAIFRSRCVSRLREDSL